VVWSSAPVTPVPVFQKRPASWAFHVRQCLVFTENGAMNKKHPVSGSPVGENSSLIRGLRRMARIEQANRQATNRQITLQNNIGSCHGWAIAAVNHTRFHSYQLKTRRSSSSWHDITNTGQLRSRTNPGSCCVRIWHKQHGPILPAVNGTGWWCNGVGNVFLAHVRSLDTHWETFPCPEKFCLLWGQRGCPTRY
jgi:hypothetical protein